MTFEQTLRANPNFVEHGSLRKARGTKHGPNNKKAYNISKH